MAELSRYTILQLSKNDHTSTSNSARRMSPLLNIDNGDFGDATQETTNSKDYLRGIDFILYFVNEDRRDPPSPQDNNWQYTIGRLLAMDVLIKIQGTYFTHAQQEPNYPRLMIALDFAFRNLQHPHPNVFKTARKIFLILAEMAVIANPIRHCPFIKHLITSIECSDLQARFLQRFGHLLSLYHQRATPERVSPPIDHVMSHLPMQDWDDIAMAHQSRSCSKERNLLRSTSNSKYSTKQESYNKGFLNDRKNHETKELPQSTRLTDISNKPTQVFRQNRSISYSPSPHSRGCSISNQSGNTEFKSPPKEAYKEERLPKLSSIHSHARSTLLGKRKFRQVLYQDITR